MPPRKRTDPSAPMTMKELKDTLWKAADKLRGSMDASQYKDVILGLVFLKYVSDAFDERREQIRTDLAAEGYRRRPDRGPAGRPRRVHRPRRLLGPGDRPLAVPRRARQGHPRRQRPGRPDRSASSSTARWTTSWAPTRPWPAPCRASTTATTSTSAASASSSTCSTTPASPATAPPAPATCSARSTSTSSASSPPPRASAAASSTRPPASSASWSRCSSRTRGRVYDPCCGSGGMFVQTEKFLERHDADTQDICVYGQEANERTWRMAKMNLAIHGLNANLASRWGDTFARDQHADTPRWTSCWPTRRSTSRTGPAPSPTPAGSTASPRPATPTTPGSSTSCPSSPPAAAPAWSWPTGPCPPTPAARARSAPASSRPTSSPAWSPCPPSCSAPPASRSASGSSPRTRPPARAARSTAPGRCCSSTPANSATWSTAPNAPCPTRTSPASPAPSTPGAAPRPRPRPG